MDNHISLQQAKLSLQKSFKEFQVLFQHGTLTVELYKPDKIDKQMPHSRDEVYIIATGDGKFNLNGDVAKVTTGDFLFVPAKMPHHFFDLRMTSVPGFCFTGRKVVSKILTNTGKPLINPSGNNFRIF